MAYNGYFGSHNRIGGTDAKAAINTAAAAVSPLARTKRFLFTAAVFPLPWLAAGCFPFSFSARNTAEGVIGFLQYLYREAQYPAVNRK